LPDGSATVLPVTGLIEALVPRPTRLALAALPYTALVGVSLLAWHCDSRAIANANLVRSQAEQFKRMQAQATIIARDALAHQQAVYQQKAMGADLAYQAQSSAARAATHAYIAARRMQPAIAAGSTGGSASAQPRDNSPVSASLSPDAIMVSGDDLRICTDGITYALKAHEWATTVSP
jgi:hypothetical protein